jgi:hypothetical protein
MNEEVMKIRRSVDMKIRRYDDKKIRWKEKRN